MATETISGNSVIIKDDTKPEWVVMEKTVPKLTICTINSTRWRN